jgi:nicotinate (nicotinamide) nucleotide adenylyltransferase
VCIVPLGSEYTSADPAVSALVRHAMVHVVVDGCHALPTLRASALELWERDTLSILTETARQYASSLGGLTVLLGDEGVKRHLARTGVAEDAIQHQLCEVLSGVTVDVLEMDVLLERVAGSEGVPVAGLVFHSTTIALSSVTESAVREDLSSPVTRGRIYGLVPRSVHAMMLRYGWYNASLPASCSSSGRVTGDAAELCRKLWTGGEAVITDETVRSFQESLAHVGEDGPLTLVRREGAAPPRSSSSRKRIAIFGGSFDPITTGHMLIAGEVASRGDFDQVWIVPCGARPDKPSLRVPVLDRLVMCLEAVEDSFPHDAPIRVVPLELFASKALASFELFSILHRDHPELSFELVIGSDLVPTIPLWRYARQLCATVSFCCYPRYGYQEHCEGVEERPYYLQGGFGTEPVSLHVLGGGCFSLMSSSMLRHRAKHASLRDIAAHVPATAFARLQARELYID